MTNNDAYQRLRALTYRSVLGPNLDIAAVLDLVDELRDDLVVATGALQNAREWLTRVRKERDELRVSRNDAEQSLRVQAQSYRDEIHELHDRLAKLESFLDGECPTMPFPSCECCNAAARARELIASNEST